MNICGTGVLCQRCKAVSRCKVIFATVTRKSVVCQEELIWKNGAKQDSLGGQTLRVTSSKMNWSYLVDGFKHFLFSITYGIILPIDKYFSRWLKPPTSYFVHDSPRHVDACFWYHNLLDWTSQSWQGLPRASLQHETDQKHETDTDKFRTSLLPELNDVNAGSWRCYPDTTFNASFKHLDVCFPWFSPLRNCSPAVLIGTQSRPARTNPCLYCIPLPWFSFYVRC